MSTSTAGEEIVPTTLGGKAADYLDQRLGIAGAKGAHSDLDTVGAGVGLGALIERSEFDQILLLLLESHTCGHLGFPQQSLFFLHGAVGIHFCLANLTLL